MTQGKPMLGVNVHYLGNDVLKRFNTVFDFQKNLIYLKPNQLYQMPYADQKSNPNPLTSAPQMPCLNTF
jgi:hypothetical protein